MKKKIIIALVVLVSIALILVIGNKIYWNYRIAHAVKIVELTTDKVYVFQSNVTIKKLLKELNGTLKTNPKINTEIVGKQEVTFKYVNDENIPIEYTVEIEVVDVTPPIVFQSKRKTIYTGYDSDLAKDLFCGDNYDPNPKCTIEGEYDVNTPGEYELTFIGEDQSGNKAKNTFTLTVKNKPTSSSSGGGTSSYTDFNEVKEKYAAENAHFGIDISHWQGDINFQKVKDAGVEFVYIRVGRGDGIGKDYVLDDKFEQNIKGFNEVGIPVGVYFYSNANSREDAEKEAKWMMKKIKKYKVDLELVYDWEDWGNFQYYDLSFHELQESFQSFKKAVEAAGYKGMVYGSKSYLETAWNTPAEAWLAHYTEYTSYMGNYKVWQLCEDGKVSGINGYVDLDIRYE